MDKLILNGQALTLSEIGAVSLAGCRVEVAPDALRRVAESRGLIEKILAAGETVYGVNTGFGKLADVRIPGDKLAELQINLVRSHAGGVGDPLAEAEARAMLLLRANVLAKGFSGVRPELLQLLVDLLNAGVHPVIPEKGSVGASGDLAPLAHLALGSRWRRGSILSRRADCGRRGPAPCWSQTIAAYCERGTRAAEWDAGHDGCGRVGRGARTAGCRALRSLGRDVARSAEGDSGSF